MNSQTVKVVMLSAQNRKWLNISLLVQPCYLSIVVLYYHILFNYIKTCITACGHG